MELVEPLTRGSDCRFVSYFPEKSMFNGKTVHQSDVEKVVRARELIIFSVFPTMLQPFMPELLVSNTIVSHCLPFASKIAPNLQYSMFH